MCEKVIIPSTGSHELVRFRVNNRLLKKLTGLLYINRINFMMMFEIIYLSCQVYLANITIMDYKKK